MRADLNVPIQAGKITDMTRIHRAAETIASLAGQGAKVVVLSHFGRPEGKFDISMSLAPVTNALAEALGREVKFGVDCVGQSAENAVDALQNGQVLLLENLRFHEGEEKNDAQFAAALAKLGDIYINDAFSCSHRSHASITGLARLLPAYAGRLMQEELENLEKILSNPQKPMAAIVGGSKISTKLELLDSLIEKVDLLVIGGGMANTFLRAGGIAIGTSISEPKLLSTARAIMEKARKRGCELLLPVDLVTAREFAKASESHVLPSAKIPHAEMAIDIGPKTAALIGQKLSAMKTVIWNGPLGAFELTPFDCGTVGVAREVASLTLEGKILSVAGGGDTVAALSHAAVLKSFSYVSTAGGAFLEWLEGKELPGVAALKK